MIPWNLKRVVPYHKHIKCLVFRIRECYVLNREAGLWSDVYTRLANYGRGCEGGHYKENSTQMSLSWDVCNAVKL